MRCTSAQKRILYGRQMNSQPHQDRNTNQHTGKYVPSSDLVPGDIYELSDPNLSQFPSDSLLLTGDCIVNESMLTGKG